MEICERKRARKQNKQFKGHYAIAYFPLNCFEVIKNREHCQEAPVSSRAKKTKINSDIHMDQYSYEAIEGST